LSVFTVGLDFFGKRTTVTVQVPFLMPRTVLPTNLQYFVPRVMEMRIVPCERLGIFNDTAVAIFAAVRDRLRPSLRVFTAVTLVIAFGVLDAVGEFTEVEVARVVVVASVVVLTTVVVAIVVVVAGKASKNGTTTALLLLI
jgi:hypothetical protein